MRAIATIIYSTGQDQSGIVYDAQPDFSDVPLSSIQSDLNGLVSLDSGEVTIEKSGQYIVSGFAAYAEVSG